jgi:hypothetical protein
MRRCVLRPNYRMTLPHDRPSLSRSQMDRSLERSEHTLPAVCLPGPRRCLLAALPCGTITAAG